MMGCETVKVPGGAVIVCTRGGRKWRCACGLAGGFQCDWKMSAGKTCDKHLCPDHGLEVAKDKHLCPQHQEAYKVWQARKAKAAA